jgi:transglutaminase-like putative cysteine protease
MPSNATNSSGVLSRYSFEKYFRALSYALIFTGLLALFVSGGVGAFVSAIFVGFAALAWFLEDTKWQIGDRVGLILIIASIPIFYLDWKYKIGGGDVSERVAVGTLARLVLTLTIIKLLQKKNDRDWFVLYIITFFQALLAAGLSISPLLLVAFLIFLLLAASAIIAFEIRKTARGIDEKKQAVMAVAGLRDKTGRGVLADTAYKIPAVAITLLVFIVLLAVPLFFSFPRVGGAGFGALSGAQRGFTGFSDRVELGAIGRLMQNDEVVMRIKLEAKTRIDPAELKWRGVALDSFDHKVWKKSRVSNVELVKFENGAFRLKAATNESRLVTQQVYLEPIDSPVVFALADALALQGGFGLVTRDAENSINMNRTEPGRVSYRAVSDVRTPDAEELRLDSGSDFPARYTDLPPRLDPKIAELAESVFNSADANNNFDRAKAVESFLKTNFGYSLEMKAGSSQPLSDFLFNVKQGHCEYFASAMAIMLRTQGIPTRIVNGFQSGSYNETAGMYVVRQKDAHSWVEVYFPDKRQWIAFDPTPAQTGGEDAAVGGLMSRFNNYIEALESFWVQYVVAYDNQEQRSLARTLSQKFSDAQNSSSTFLNDLLEKAKGTEGLESQIYAIGKLAGVVLLGMAILFVSWFLARRLAALKVWQSFSLFRSRKKQIQVVEFYQRMLNILDRRGLRRDPHLTPAEFARDTKLPEVARITEAYNAVRFGRHILNGDEARQLNIWLTSLEKLEKAER